MNAHYIHLQETDSTNRYATALDPNTPHGTTIYTDRQTAGRGQRGNSWESEPGKNLTASIILRPEAVVTPKDQFLLSEICAIAIVRTLDRYTAGITIKWPNDIYWNDQKICGILIEHTLTAGRINRTICGIGLNLNQTAFLSDAPNPVSLKNITGNDYDVRDVLEQITAELLGLFDTLPEAADTIHAEFLSRLYRRTGIHPYRCAVRSQSGNDLLMPGDVFKASILTVRPDGMLQLQRPNGAIHTFAFKEVAIVMC